MRNLTGMQSMCHGLQLKGLISKTVVTREACGSGVASRPAESCSSHLTYTYRKPHGAVA